jgi:hypothetical protein
VIRVWRGKEAPKLQRSDGPGHDAFAP